MLSSEINSVYERLRFRKKSLVGPRLADYNARSFGGGRRRKALFEELGRGKGCAGGGHEGSFESGHLAGPARVGPEAGGSTEVMPAADGVVLAGLVSL